MADHTDIGDKLLTSPQRSLVTRPIPGFFLTSGLSNDCPPSASTPATPLAGRIDGDNMTDDQLFYGLFSSRTSLPFRTRQIVPSGGTGTSLPDGSVVLLNIEPSAIRKN